MGFLFTQMFWGIFLVLLGLVMIIKVVFGIHIPFLRLFISFLLIYMGISMLMGHFTRKEGQRSIVFDESRIQAGGSGKYDIIFGSGVIELAEPEASQGVTRVQVNVVFGSAVIKIKPGTPVKLTVDAAFAGANLPNGNQISFGEASWQSPGLDESKPYLLLDTDVVFGSLDIMTE